MSATKIGSPGLAEVDLVIPQGTTLRFSVAHKDEDGNAVNHTTSTIKAVIQNADGTNVADLSTCCTGTATGIDVAIPASVGNGLDAGKLYRWDMVVSMTGGDVVRLAYGTISVVDTYSLDEGE